MLEKDVEMKTAVKDVMTIAKSMIHITVQLTTRAFPVRIRSLRALVAQDEMECFKGQACIWLRGNCKLRSLVEKYRDIWRVSLIDDGPAKLKPFKVHLKSDAIPRRARARKYAPKHRDWMIKQVKMLGSYVRIQAADGLLQL